LLSSGATLSRWFDWYVAGTFVVKVRARDEHGVVSDWSTGLTVIVT